MSDEKQTPRITWLEQCEKIKATLREANTATEEIVGVVSHDQSEPCQEPSNLAEKLTDELETALNLAERLSDQVRRITERFRA